MRGAPNGLGTPVRVLPAHPVSSAEMKKAWLLLLLPWGAAAHGACPSAATLCATFDAATTRIDGPEATSVISLGGLKRNEESRRTDLVWDIVNKLPPGKADPARIRIVDMGGARGGVLEVSTLDDDRCVESGSCGPHHFERSEIGLTAGRPEPTDAVDGAEQWWAHSVYFPAGFQMAAGDGRSSIFMQFHNGRGPAIELGVFNQYGRNRWPVIRVQAKGPNPILDPYSHRPYGDGTQYHYQAPGAQLKKGQCIHDRVRRERWYDFVHHIRWSSNGQGIHRIWMREGDGPLKLVFDKKGLSLLYPPGERSGGRNYAFFRIGTYHDPVVPGVSSVRHDRVVRGATYEAVRMPDMPQALPAGLALCAGALVDH